MHFQGFSHLTLTEISFRRDWHNYSKELLMLELRKVHFDQEIVDVLNYWNAMEETLLQVVDLVAPVVEFTTGSMPIV